MFSSDWRNDLFKISLYILAFIIAMPFIFGAIAIIILVCAWLIQGNFKAKIKSLKHPAYLLWIGFYLLHAISYLYSENKSESLFDLQAKLSFLLIPVVVGTGIKLNTRVFERICFSFIAGITVVAFFCVTKGFITYYKTGDESFLYYHTLVRDLDANAVYMAFYTIFSLFLLIFYNWNFFFRKKRGVWRWLIFSLQFTFFILLSSRLLIVIFFLFIITIGFKSLIENRKVKFVQKAFVIFFILITAFSMVFTNNPIKRRYTVLKSGNLDAAFIKDYHQKKFGLDNLSVRPFVWRVCIQNISEKNLWWIGCGNGDINDIQNQKMREIGVPNMNKDDNPRSNMFNFAIHNMYLQTLMILGIPGLVTLLLIVFCPFFYLFRSDEKIVFLTFHVTGALFMFQESALQTQAGIIYFTFFSIIFWNLYYSASGIFKKS